MSEPRFICPLIPAVKSLDAKPFGSVSCPLIRYYPGRWVSVQFGMTSPHEDQSANTRARIRLRFDTTDPIEPPCTPPSCDGQPSRLQGPTVSVLAAGEPDIIGAFPSDQSVTLFVEQCFLGQTVASDITAKHEEDLAALSSKDPLVVPLIDVFRILSRREQRGNAQYVEALGTVAAAHVLQLFFGSAVPADMQGGLSAEALQRVVSYIDSHYADEFDVEALARVSGFSRNHFQRLFKKSFKQTPREYVRGCQVQQAIILLQTTNLKGLDVALACGFCDETQMARWFGKLRGCPPGQVREAARW
jgi:AraC-like DNA-binding protein